MGVGPHLSRTRTPVGVLGLLRATTLRESDHKVIKGGSTCARPRTATATGGPPGRDRRCAPRPTISGSVPSVKRERHGTAHQQAAGTHAALIRSLLAIRQALEPRRQYWVASCSAAGPDRGQRLSQPSAINRQNARCTARDGSGRPGDCIGGRNALRGGRSWSKTSARAAAAAPGARPTWVGPSSSPPPTAFTVGSCGAPMAPGRARSWSRTSTPAAGSGSPRRDRSTPRKAR